MSEVGGETLSGDDLRRLVALNGADGLEVLHENELHYVTACTDGGRMSYVVVSRSGDTVLKFSCRLDGSDLQDGRSPNTMPAGGSVPEIVASVRYFLDFFRIAADGRALVQPGPRALSDCEVALLRGLVSTDSRRRSFRFREKVYTVSALMDLNYVACVILDDNGTTVADFCYNFEFDVFSCVTEPRGGDMSFVHDFLAEYELNRPAV